MRSRTRPTERPVARTPSPRRRARAARTSAAISRLTPAGPVAGPGVVVTSDSSAQPSGVGREQGRRARRAALVGLSGRGAPGRSRRGVGCTRRRRRATVPATSGTCRAPARCGQEPASTPSGRSSPRAGRGAPRAHPGLGELDEGAGGPVSSGSPLPLRAARHAPQEGAQVRLAHADRPGARARRVPARAAAARRRPVASRARGGPGRRAPRRSASCPRAVARRCRSAARRSWRRRGCRPLARLVVAAFDEALPATAAASRAAGRRRHRWRRHRRDRAGSSEA